MENINLPCLYVTATEEKSLRIKHRISYIFAMRSVQAGELFDRAIAVQLDSIFSFAYRQIRVHKFEY